MRDRARARLLRRLARLSARGVPLPEALGALAAEHPRLRAAAQIAAEGGSLDAALSESALLELLPHRWPFVLIDRVGRIRGFFRSDNTSLNDLINAIDSL